MYLSNWMRGEARRFGWRGSGLEAMRREGSDGAVHLDLYSSAIA